MREVQDHYFRKAKSEGYVARSAYKLIEINERKRILKPGDWVLDCGAAPGSWMQVAAKRVGRSGVVVGIDLKEIRQAFEGAATRTIAGDLQTIGGEALLKAANESAGGVAPAEAGSGGGGAALRKFDVVLSDMAPNTSGDHTSDHHLSVRLCNAVLALCPGVLKPGGHLVMKVFEGEAYMDLVRRTQAMFEQAKGFKPAASRDESREMYVVATGFRGAGRGKGLSDGAHAAARRQPSRGWGKQA